MSLFFDESPSLHAYVEILTRDTGEPRCFGDIASSCFQHPFQVIALKGMALNLVGIYAGLLLTFNAGHYPFDTPHDMCRIHWTAGMKSHKSLQGMLQFADIAGPIVGFQPAYGIRRQGADLLVEFFVKVIEKVSGEAQQVAVALAQ